MNILISKQRWKFFKAFALVGALVVASACTKEQQEPQSPELPIKNQKEAPNEAKLEKIQLNLDIAGGTESPEVRALANDAVGAIESDLDLIESGRSLNINVDTGNGIHFDVPNGQKFKLLLIFRNKTSGETIYVPHVEFTGKGTDASGRATFSNKSQGNYTAYRVSNTDGANTSSPYSVGRGERDWYVMAVSENPEDTNGGLSDKLQYVYTGSVFGGGFNPLTFSAEAPASGNNVLAVGDTPIPLISDWVPVDEVPSNNYFRAVSSGHKIVLKPQGIVLRLDIENLSPYPQKVKAFEMESNLLWSNVRYDLRPNKLPTIGTANSNSKIVWEDLEPYNTAFYSNRFMMGSSFTISAPFDAATAGTAANKISTPMAKYDGTVTSSSIGVKNRSRFYIWAMPKTNAQITTAKSGGNVGVSAFYLNTEVVTYHAGINYTTPRETTYDQDICNGETPAPGYGWDLVNCTTNQFRNADGTPMNGKLVKIRLKIKNRAPLPVEMLARNNARRPSSTSATYPEFQNEENQPAWTADDENYYISWSNYTNVQPDGSTNWDKLRIKSRNSSGRGLDKFHIPRTSEINALISPYTLKFAGAQNSDVPQPVTVQDQSAAVWIPENHYLSYSTSYPNGAEVTRYSKFLDLTMDETELIQGTRDVGRYLLSVRGVKMNSGDLSKFLPTEDMCVNLYSYGNNAFFIETIPISKNYVTRLGGISEKLWQFWKTDPWIWNFYRDTKITRQIRRVGPFKGPYSNIWFVGGGRGSEPNDGLYIMSGDNTDDNYINMWGLHNTGDFTEDGYLKKKGMYIAPFKNYTRNKSDTWYHRFPARMFVDKPWVYTATP